MPSPGSWRRLAALLTLGLASGIPLDLTRSTFQLWFSDAGLDTNLLALFPALPFLPDPDFFLLAAGAETVDLTDLGFLSLVGLPYVLKPLWSPALDRFVPPGLRRLGRRRAWMAASQVGILAGLVAMGLGSPVHSPSALVLVAFVVAMFSATQDIVVDAWRTDVLPPAERPLGVTLSSTGYRGGMLIAGALCPALATIFDWNTAYLAMAGVMALGLLATLLAPVEPAVAPPKSLGAAVVLPFRDLFRREHIWLLLAIVLLYKLGDAFGSSLFSAFLRRGLDFNPAEIGATRKVVGVTAVFAGTFVAAFLMARLTLGRALLVFGILQALTNLAFVGLAAADKSLLTLSLAIAGENLATGMGQVPFLVLLTVMCDARFSATQFALLSSLAALGTTLIGPIAGPTAEGLGWQGFFWVSAVAALPGLWLVVRGRRVLDALGQRATAAPSDAG